jgi:hypothetical protein
MLGLPAAALLGAAFENKSLDCKGAAVAPNQQWMLAHDRESGTPVLVRLTRSRMELRELNLPAAPQRLLWSPDGRAAALAYFESRQIAVLRNPGEALELRLFDLPASEVTALALSDSGSVAVATREGESTVLSVAEWNGSWSRETLDGPVSALAYDGDALLAAVGGSILRRSGGETAAVAVWEGTVQIASVASTVRYWIAVSTDSEILVWDRSTGAVRLARCDCEPGALQSMGGGVFRLTGLQEGGVVLLDTASESLILRIPPPVRAGAAAEQEVQR